MKPNLSARIRTAAYGILQVPQDATDEQIENALLERLGRPKYATSWTAPESRELPGRASDRRAVAAARVVVRTRNGLAGNDVMAFILADGELPVINRVFPPEQSPTPDGQLALDV